MSIIDFTHLQRLCDKYLAETDKVERKPHIAYITATHTDDVQAFRNILRSLCVSAYTAEPRIPHVITRIYLFPHYTVVFTDMAPRRAS